MKKLLSLALACLLLFSLSACGREPKEEVSDEKPVIYLYPEQETDVRVTLDLAGELTCAYPAYGDGWSVRAAPDGTLTDESGQTYRYLYWEGTSGTEVLYKKVSEPKFRTLLPGFDADYAPVECRDGQLYYVTNRDASNYALMKVDLNDPSKVSTVIPESGGKLLEGVGSAGGYLFATYLEHAQSKVCQYGFDGKLVREIELPAIGTVSGFDGEKDDTELYYSLTNYIAPATIYKYDIAGGASTLYKAPAVNFDPSLFTTEQVFYTSKDGTKVPMFITRRKNMKLDGGNPCYLYAYGGFQINQTPAFRPSAMMFVEQGGIYCVANLRGGSEYGEAWHKAGMLENKQNVFDDFIAAAEYLIAEKYTSSDKLAIAGGSNGGLLVGACEVQRPDLYAVCLPAVGVMDMLRYHKFTIGWGWAVEYGSSENEEQFDYIYKYSPLHNIREGVKYPATLVTTADHDDRVVVGALVQVRRPDAALSGRRCAGADPHRVECGPRGRQTHFETYRRGGGHLFVPVPEYRSALQRAEKTEMIRAEALSRRGKRLLREALGCGRSTRRSAAGVRRPVAFGR